MLSYPGRGVQVPLQGIATMDEPAARLGRVIEGAAQLGAQLAEQQETVTAAGSLADFAGRLRQIEQESREEIDMQNVRDWQYAWKQASEPRLAEAVGELPPESREAGRHLAAVYNAQASATAKRDYELGRIGLARHRWQARVEDAVERGDAEEAERWIKAGESLFVPEEEVEERQRKVRSQSVLNCWRKAFRTDAAAALAALRREDARLPQEAADAECLQRLREEQLRAVSRAMAEEMGRAVTAGQLPSRELYEKAAAAGVMSPQQVESAFQQPEYGWRKSEGLWNLRVDECPEEGDAVTRLQLEILAAPLPPEERSRLLLRLQRGREIPTPIRTQLSRSLWNMYLSGQFGCPGDTEALQGLARLQVRGMEEMSRCGSAAELNRWLSSVPSEEDKWICFNNN